MDFSKMRSLRARVAAHAMHSKHDSGKTTAAARAAANIKKGEIDYVDGSPDEFKQNFFQDEASLEA